MAETAAHGSNVEPGSDKRRRARMSKSVEHDARQIEPLDGAAPIAAEIVGRKWRAIGPSERCARLRQGRGASAAGSIPLVGL